MWSSIALSCTPSPSSPSRRMLPCARPQRHVRAGEVTFNSSPRAARALDPSTQQVPQSESHRDTRRDRSVHEPNDPNVHDTYTTSLQQRQQFRPTNYGARSYSRPSSSSGSASNVVRRTPNFEDHPLRRPRSNSLDSPPRPQPTIRPRPPRLSRRTTSAILWTLETALRQPRPFTSDLVEENASMSDLTGGAGGNGRAANGSSRAGPVPVPQPSQATPTGMRTPRQIMEQRQQRDERKRQEAEAAALRAADEQRRAQEAEARRRSAERRAAAAGVAGQPMETSHSRTRSNTGGRGEGAYSGYAPGNIPQQDPGFGGPVVPPAQAGTSTQAGAGAAYRQRGSSLSQDQPRPVPGAVPPTASGAQRMPQPQAARPPAVPPQQRPAGAGPSAQPGPSTAGPSTQPGGQSSRAGAVPFPHAFERWETLSSHWEGLTSYWIHRLEQNTEEVRNQPLSSQMARQITDLSAAGANLFHAVVELQRLRASSERKFQRWFYDTRREQERSQETIAEMENMLRVERAARNERNTGADEARAAKRNAEKITSEMQRELRISKEEARRAWEELGRREQEERERLTALREGQPIFIGGVQVFPTMQQAVLSRQTSSAQHPGEHQYQQGGQVEDYPYEVAPSPSNTDPFTGQGQGQGGARELHHEQDVSNLTPGAHQPYPLGSTPATSGSTAMTAIPPTQQGQPSTGHLQPRPQVTQYPTTSTIPTTSAASSSSTFYRHGGAYIDSANPSQTSNQPPGASGDIDAGSYVPSLEETFSNSDDGGQFEGEDEYELDEQGNIRYDTFGQPMMYRRGLGQEGDEDSSDDDDEDTREAQRREQELLQQYPTSRPTTTTATTAAGYPTVTDAADYEGAGYEGWEGGWGGRHHHPTRLSDVIEEDERSRTSPSRASLASRGGYHGRDI
ncbi:hypothetical protein K402DRAFT_443122 [Aulographum hederae CBS 113979]|uniref:Uncharacterized protein n=1 Tax=Aulographum hederae CBS 113979 TaxID=1176131 RepID=A0A6G1HH02_9PEZI|nr:hypothetical protein K402DRAFT_443122 [Aulographum hederae CBS 113979]